MTNSVSTLNQDIDEAFVYVFPLYEVARTRYCDFLGAAGMPGLPTNTVLHDSRVCDHHKPLGDHPQQ